MVKQLGKNQWVVKHRAGWAVKAEGDTEVTRITRTQREAINLALAIAGEQGGEVIVCSESGRVKERLSPGPSQHAQIRALLARWDAEGEREPDAWWDTFDAFLRTHRADLAHPDRL